MRVVVRLNFKSASNEETAVSNEDHEGKKLVWLYDS